MALLSPGDPAYSADDRLEGAYLIWQMAYDIRILRKTWAKLKGER